MLAAAGARVGIVELVETKPVLAVGAIDERIGEVGEVAAGLPDLRRTEHGRVDQHDVVAHLHHRSDPRLADVAQHATHRVGRSRTCCGSRRRSLRTGTTKPRRLQRLTTWSSSVAGIPARLRATAMLPRTSCATCEDSRERRRGGAMSKSRVIALATTLGLIVVAAGCSDDGSSSATTASSATSTPTSLAAPRRQRSPRRRAGNDAGHRGPDNRGADPQRRHHRRRRHLPARPVPRSRRARPI